MPKIIQIISHDGELLGLADSGDVFTYTETKYSYVWIMKPAEFEVLE